MAPGLWTPSSKRTWGRSNYSLPIMSMDVVQASARWIGAISSVLTFVLGIVHIVTYPASVSWPDGGFLDDVNAWSWRSLFTFAPSVIATQWTPLLFGILGILMHMDKKYLQWGTATFAHYFVFNFVKGLFADIAYAGGLGIIFSVVTWITCLLCLICYFLADENASLGLTVRFQVATEK